MKTLYYCLFFLIFSPVQLLKSQDKSVPLGQDTIPDNKGYGFVITIEKDTIHGMISNRLFDSYCRVLYVDTISNRYKMYHPKNILKFQMGERTYISYKDNFLELLYKSGAVNLYRIIEPSINQNIPIVGLGATAIMVASKGLYKIDLYYLDKVEDKKIKGPMKKKDLFKLVIKDHKIFREEAEKYSWKELKKGNVLVNMIRRYKGEE